MQINIYCAFCASMKIKQIHGLLRSVNIRIVKDLRIFVLRLASSTQLRKTNRLNTHITFVLKI